MTELRCPVCETGTLTLCTGPVVTEAIFADPLSTTGELNRHVEVAGFVACNACEYVRRTADILKGQVYS